MNKLLGKITRLDSIVNWLFLIILPIYIYLIVVSKTVLFVKNDVAYMIIKYSIKVCLVSFLLFTAYHIVTFEFSKKFTILLIVIGLLVVINYYFCKRGTILLFYCFTICAKNYTPKNLFKLFFFAFSFSFFYTFFCPKNRHIFLRFFALKNVIFFTLKNAKKISKNISFWRFKFHYFYFIFTQHQSNQ